MEQDKCAVPDLSETEKQGGEVPEGKMAGDENPTHGDALQEQMDALAPGSGAHGNAAVESNVVEEVLEEALADQSEGIAVVCNAGRRAASGSAMDDEDLEAPENPLATRFRFRAAIARPTPPMTYRRLPLRSRKQYYPTRFAAAGAAPATTTRSTGVSAMSTTEQGVITEAQGSAVTCSEMGNSSSGDCEGGTDATSTNVAASSTSFRHSRKQRRPDHFIPEEAEASARAKAPRSTAVLDWVRNAAADDDSGHGEGAIYGSRSASGEGPEERGGRARILAVLAVLGIALTLCVISLVLFYIIGWRTEHGRPKDSNVSAFRNA